MAILLENGEPRVGFILEMAYLRGFTFIDFDSVKTQEDIKKAQKLIAKRNLKEIYNVYMWWKQEYLGD